MKHAIYKPKIVAVGEIGLDYHWNDNRDEQIAWFEKQMELAREAELPIIVHSREAAKDTLDVMKASRQKKSEESFIAFHMKKKWHVNTLIWDSI